MLIPGVTGVRVASSESGRPQPGIQAAFHTFSTSKDSTFFVSVLKATRQLKLISEADSTCITFSFQSGSRMANRVHFGFVTRIIHHRQR
jgi:hypothetical protein